MNYEFATWIRVIVTKKKKKKIGARMIQYKCIKMLNEANIRSFNIRGLFRGSS